MPNSGTYYFYAPAAPASVYAPNRYDYAPCPSLSTYSLGALFDCAR